jgi:hypothetical protein
MEAKLQEKDKQHEIDLLKQKVAHLEKDNKELKAYIKSGNLAPTYNISVKKYIQKNYSDAPALGKLELSDYAMLTYEPEVSKKSGKKKKVTDNDSNEDMDDVMNNKLIQILIYNYNNNTLHKFFGDFIVKNYKKEDPSQQAIWNSDVSRLTYIIKELLYNNIESRWSSDFKGVKTKNYIITPLLKYIRKCIDEYWIRSVDSFKELDTKSLETLQMDLIILQKIKKEIDNHTLADDIVKFIAPEFYMSKGSDKLIEYFIDEEVNV